MPSRKSRHVGGQQMPMFVPESDWRPPAELPDLRSVGIVAIDRETRDDGLAAGRGPGWAHGAGHVIGCSVAWKGGSFYAPLRHPDSDNFPTEQYARWENDLIRSGVRIVYHNGPYDIGWGNSDLGIDVPSGSQIEDTTAAAVMVDENRTGHRPYSLDNVCRWRGVPGKDRALLREAAEAYGYPDYMANLHRFPARFVGPYAEADATSTLALYHSLIPEIREQDMEEAYRLEMDLVPMVHAMRKRGIRVSIDRAEQYRDALISKRDQILAELSRQIGGVVEMSHVRSPRWMSAAFHDHAPGIQIPRTKPTTKFAEGQESFAKWMRGHAHWLPRLCAEAEQLEETASKFLQGFVIDYAHAGRLHANVNQFRGEEGGTRSHRFSYSDPPLQQMPGDKQPAMRDMVRDVFEPEEGEIWCSPDYSQQEMKLIVEFAALLNCERADEAMRRYQEDPTTDFHTMVAELTGLERRHAKDVNFAKAFGAGVKKFAGMTGHDEEDAARIMGQYDREMPFVQQLYEKCQRLANRRGYVRMCDGARAHFDDWEPAWIDREDRDRGWRDGWDMWPCRLEEAKLRQEGAGKHAERPTGPHPWAGTRLRRADTRKAMNRLVQGSAARQMKKAMRLVWREGITPLLQMHDELNVSVGAESTGRRVAELMRDAHPFRLPFSVDVEYGVTWGRARKVKEKKDGREITVYGATYAEAVAVQVGGHAKARTRRASRKVR